MPGLLILPLPLQLFLSSTPSLLQHGTFMLVFTRCVLSARLERKLGRALVSPPLGSVRMKNYFFVCVNNNQPLMRRQFTWEALQLSAKQSTELPQLSPVLPAPRGRERGKKRQGAPLCPRLTPGAQTYGQTAVCTGDRRPERCEWESAAYVPGAEITLSCEPSFAFPGVRFASALCGANGSVKVACCWREGEGKTRQGKTRQGKGKFVAYQLPNKSQRVVINDERDQAL